MQKSIRCDKCEKIISLYRTDLYATDAYCVMCHGKPLNMDKYEILNYKIQNISRLQTIINFLGECSLFMSIGMNGMKIKQRNGKMGQCIQIKISDIKLDVYSYEAKQIGLHIRNSQLRQLINSENIHTSEISVYNKSNDETAYLKINNYQSKLSTSVHRASPNLCNCNVHIVCKNSIMLPSIEFNKLCMSLTTPHINIEIQNNKLIFIESNAKNHDTYVFKNILSISKIALLADNIILYLSISQLVFLIQIDKTTKIKIAQAKFRRYSWYN